MLNLLKWTRVCERDRKMPLEKRTFTIGKTIPSSKKKNHLAKKLKMSLVQTNNNLLHHVSVWKAAFKVCCALCTSNYSTVVVVFVLVHHTPCVRACMGAIVFLPGPARARYLWLPRATITPDSREVRPTTHVHIHQKCRRADKTRPIGWLEKCHPQDKTTRWTFSHTQYPSPPFHPTNRVWSHKHTTQRDGSPFSTIDFCASNTKQPQYSSLGHTIMLSRHSSNKYKHRHTHTFTKPPPVTLQWANS